MRGNFAVKRRILPTAFVKALSILLLLCTFLLAVPPRASADPTPPAESFSFYMQTVDQSTLYNLGNTFGKDVADGSYPTTTLVILDWGQPYCTSSGSGSCGSYLLSNGTPYEGTAAERAAAEQFGEGFYYGTGADVSAHTYIAMGINNYGSWFDNFTNANNHGIAWANMVTDGNNWFQTNGYSSQASMRAAVDFELDWNPPGQTKAWVNGYDSTGTAPDWDFGDAAGCPPFGSCDNGWTQGDVAFVAWNSPWGEPLPEIYANNLAEEWGSFANYDPGMTFLGPLSQHQACADLGDSCTGVDNTPDQAWDQLYDQLNCGSCETPQTPPHVSNIRWHLTETK